MRISSIKGKVNLIKSYTKCIFLLQPDITGPGVNILAAWSPVATTATAERSVKYNIISGVIIFGPMEENTATSGAGLVFRTVVVGKILPTGFLQQQKSTHSTDFFYP